MLKGYVRATLVIFNNYIIKYIFFNGFLITFIILDNSISQNVFLDSFLFLVDFKIFMRVICAKALYYLRSYNELGCN